MRKEGSGEGRKGGRKWGKKEMEGVVKEGSGERRKEGCGEGVSWEGKKREG